MCAFIVIHIVIDICIDIDNVDNVTDIVWWSAVRPRSSSVTDIGIANANVPNAKTQITIRMWA